MSEEALQVAMPAASAQARSSRSFVSHAKVISGFTLLSRILGVLRESFAARYFGAGLVSSAFYFAFAIPNLFRRLFGEGALSAAFIPLYSESVKQRGPEEARRFATASINLLVSILVILTLIGELILWTIARFCEMNWDRLLAVKLTAIMLPYALLICSTAFMGAILQVHRKFGLVAAAPIILNIFLIGSTVLAARFWNLRNPAGQVAGIKFIAWCVVVAGVAQVMLLVPSLRRIGFRLELASFWTPAVKRMLKLSIPVAIGAGVLQFSVLMDRAISYLLAQHEDIHGNLITSFTLFGHSIDYPMQLGAVSRLLWAQLIYQFPLGVFAIALATAIFPTLAADALESDRARFRESLRRGMEVALWEGLPASVGLMIVATPTVQILFERGQFTPHDTALVAGSLQMFSAAIWAFSLQQILNRAYYALHDTWTPLKLSIMALAIDLTCKLSLIWSLGEKGMAVGTSISFVVQVCLMLLLLRRRVGRLGLTRLSKATAKLLIATGGMAAACWLIHKATFFPQDHSKRTALLRLSILVICGGTVYLGLCTLMRVGLTARRSAS